MPVGGESPGASSGQLVKHPDFSGCSVTFDSHNTGRCYKSHERADQQHSLVTRPETHHMAERTTVTITRDQHEKLRQIKSHLKEQATENLELGQTGYSPSMIDAVGFLFNKAEEAYRLQNSEAEGEDSDLPEDHPWHPSNLDSDDVGSASNG